MFAPDLAKLDLNAARLRQPRQAARAPIPGRTVGPKAAKLGELKSRFPERVAPASASRSACTARRCSTSPTRAGRRPSTSGWSKRFRQLEALPAGSPEAAASSEALRAEIYGIVRNIDPGPAFRERLRAAMAREFGADFKGGVFIRSDTNVEDLPGFTGAGLNLTLFNVVGFDNIVKGIAEVWASPYTARAWAWRQSHMYGARARLPGGAAAARPCRRRCRA